MVAGTAERISRPVETEVGASWFGMGHDGVPPYGLFQLR